MNFIAKIRYSLIGKFLRDKITEERTYFALTIVTGVCSALAAVSLHHGVDYIRKLAHTLDGFEPKSFLFGGALILVSGWLTTRKFQSTSGSGIPNVRLALAVHHGRIRIQDTLAKFLTSLLTLGSGVSLGREGPTVAITSGIGSYLGTFFSLSKKRIQALVAVGSASGIAAAFHTPISAVVFTLEEIVGDLNAKILGSIMISSVTAVVVSQALTGHEEVITQLYYKLNHKRELFFYLGIGLSASILGPLWMNTVMGLRKFNQTWMGGHRLTYIMISFFLVGVMSFIHPGVLGSGQGTLQETLLSLIQDPKVLLTLFILKFMSTSLCYSSGMSGGLFMPTLFIGAMMGSLVGALCNHFYPHLASNSGAYALVGMGAFFASVIRAPFTSILMVFELTRDYNIILPLMIANITSYVISSRLTNNKSIYERISEQDGIHLPSHDDDAILESLNVEDAMIEKVVFLDGDRVLNEVYEKIKGKDITGYPVLLKGKLIGMVAIADIRKMVARDDGERKIKEICEKKIIKIYPDQSLLVALHRLNRFQVSRLPVVSRLDERRLVGIITAEDIVKKFGYELQEHEVIEPDKKAETSLDHSEINSKL